MIEWWKINYTKKNISYIIKSINQKRISQGKNNLKLERMDGMKFNLLTEQWSLSSDNSVNYITKFKKN